MPPAPMAFRVSAGSSRGSVPPVDGGQPVALQVLAGGEGVLQTGGGQEIAVHIVHEPHAADGLHHQLRQSEAVVAVDAEGTGVRRQRLGGELLQQCVVGLGAGLAEEHGVGEARALDAGGVVQQHPDGDVFVPLVRHGEVLEIPGHRRVQRDPALLRQLQHGGGGVDLADGADAVELVPGHQQVLRPGEGAGLAGEDDLPVLPQGVLEALGAAVLQGVSGGGVRQGLEVRGLGGLRGPAGSGGVRRQGGDRQAQGQEESQHQGAPARGQCLHKQFLSAPKGDCAGRSGVMTVSGYASRAGRSSKNFDRLAEW